MQKVIATKLVTLSFVAEITISSQLRFTFSHTMAEFCAAKVDYTTRCFISETRKKCVWEACKTE